MTTKRNTNRVTRTSTAKRSNRPNRTPVGGARDILTVSNKDPNYHYAWINDRGGKINEFFEAGYDFVSHDAEIGHKSVESFDDKASIISKEVGSGVTAFLMRQPMELFLEDKKRKQEKVDATEAQINRTRNGEGDGLHGKITVGNTG